MDSIYIIFLKTFIFGFIGIVVVIGLATIFTSITKIKLVGSFYQALTLGLFLSFGLALNKEFFLFNEMWGTAIIASISIVIGLLFFELFSRFSQKK